MGLMDRDYWREKHNAKRTTSAQTRRTIQELQRGIDARSTRPRADKPSEGFQLATAVLFWLAVGFGAFALFLHFR